MIFAGRRRHAPVRWRLFLVLDLLEKTREFFAASAAFCDWLSAHV